jgi:flagellar capping protein FliD
MSPLSTLLFSLLPPSSPSSPSTNRDNELLTTLSSIKKDLEDIKIAMHDVQAQEDDQWRRVDNMMAFMQDLRSAMAEREKGKTQAAQTYKDLRRGPGY